MKSKKMYKSIVAIALVCVMLVMCMGAGYGGGTVAYASDSEINFDELVAVVVFETEDEVLTAYVTLDKVAEYTNRLENEIGYRENQISMIRHSNLAQSRCPTPPSNSYYLSSSRHLNKNDVKNILDTYGMSIQEWNDLQSKPYVQIAKAIIAITNLGSMIDFALLCLNLTISTLGSGMNSWWENSYGMLIRGEINAICHCVYVNTGSDYPKAWVYNSRI